MDPIRRVEAYLYRSFLDCYPFHTTQVQWLKSSGHCSNIYTSGFNHVGVGSWNNYWAQVFATRPTYAASRILDGAHWLDATKTGGQLRFFATFSSSSGAPQAINVTAAGSVYVLTLHLGEAGQGIYSVDVPASVASSGCASYFFQATTTSGNWRVPEMGSYLTTGVGGCTSNYLAAGAPSPTLTTPTPMTAPTSPPVATSDAPTKHPSLAPTAGPSLASIANPSKEPSQVPTISPSSASTTGISSTNVPTRVSQDWCESLRWMFHNALNTLQGPLSLCVHNPIPPSSPIPFNVCQYQEPTAHPTPTVTPAPTRNRLQTALYIGDASNVTLGELRTALRAVVDEAANLSATVAAIPWGEPAQHLSLTWDPSHDSLQLQISDIQHTAALFTTNYQYKDPSGTTKFILATAGYSVFGQGGRMAAFGANPLAIQWKTLGNNTGGSEFDTAMINVVRWLLHEDGSATSTSALTPRIVTAHLPGQSSFW